MGASWGACLGGASAALILLAVGCSSSSNGSGAADTGTLFGKHDASDAKSGVKDASGDHLATNSSSQQPKVDAGCGAKSATDWCDTNAPHATAESLTLCDDFDTGEFGNLYTYVGVSASNILGTYYVSPYCALELLVGDGGAPRSSTLGSFTEHVYEGASGSAQATLSADLRVPGGTACNGATVGRLIAMGDNATLDDAIYAWLTISDIQGSGDTATSYTLSLTAAVGAGAKASTPVSVTVAPRSTDRGWARIGLDVTSYSFTSTTGSFTGSATWGYSGQTKTAGSSTASPAVTGTLVTATASGAVYLDVGLPPGPDGTPTSGCHVFVDDFVTNIGAGT